jgi:hypothetical protein
VDAVQVGLFGRGPDAPIRERAAVRMNEHVDRPSEVDRGLERVGPQRVEAVPDQGRADREADDGSDGSDGSGAERDVAHDRGQRQGRAQPDRDQFAQPLGDEGASHADDGVDVGGGDGGFLRVHGALGVVRIQEVVKRGSERTKKYRTNIGICKEGMGYKIANISDITNCFIKILCLVMLNARRSTGGPTGVRSDSEVVRDERA